MKKILMFLAVAAIVSCSKDDDSNDDVTADPVVETAFYLESVKVEYPAAAPVMVTMGYNDDKELIDMDVASIHYDITYQNGYIKTFVGNNSNVEFTYDNNIVTSITTNGAVTNVDFDSATNKYLLTDSGSGYTLSSYGDLTLTEYPNTESTYYGYDTSKKGAIFNYPIKNPFWIFALINGPSIFGIKACTSYGTVEIENTFNTDGYITKAVYRQAGVLQNTITYTYSEL